MSIMYKINRAIRLLTFKKRPKTSAVILAAGSGSRMNMQQTKQMLMLAGKPLFVWSVLEFEKCPYIDEIILVCRRDEIQLVREIISAYEIKKLSAITEGGSTRQLSTLAGFEKISHKANFVAIHDSARACITAEMISKVVAAAHGCGAASATGAVVDTIKRVDKSGYIAETINRDELVLAQTPQVFKCDLYRAALYTAIKKNVRVTDDNMLIERLGYRIKSVDCSRNNFKVTTENDLRLAEEIISGREKNE